VLAEGKVEVINLTPHDLILFDEQGEEEIARIEKSGRVARVETQATVIEEVEIDGHTVPIVKTSYGKIADLPESREGTMYVVSIVALQAVRSDRSDVVAPDTGPQSVVRDAGGQIRGVRRFMR